ncbi:hypothetical protein [Pseudomonas alkylphenolica]|uniref:hypothetical protein n=1 Tax=Pseudomonas alkylphenolica TaxID=237609 RepID=UPI0018DA1449|nr:hypothetical protein [Pseudomonas alkylphenolica]MBH3428102.1 hypothetical protein [Pseudomonas alkylphenolica]
MARQFDWVRVFCVLMYFTQKLIPRRLTEEEAGLLRDFRTLHEQDRVALRYMCTAIRETSKQSRL